MKLTKKQKENLSKLLFDVGKLILATVVLGRFISGQPVHIGIIIGGVTFVLFCFISATYLDQGE